MREKTSLGFLEDASIDRTGKAHIMSLLKQSSGKRDRALESRIYMFYGDPGVGKTYLAERIINLLDKETVFYGVSDFRTRRTIACRSFDEVIRKISSSKEQIVYLDDVAFLLGAVEDDAGRNNPEKMREFMKILGIIEKNESKTLIMTLNDPFIFSEKQEDRIDVQIEVDTPTTSGKKAFLKSRFGNRLTCPQVRQISEKSIGYSYRDLPELVKLAHRFGNGSITKESIREAIEQYSPTRMMALSVHHVNDAKLKNLIGLDHVKSALKKHMMLQRSRALGKRLGVNTSKLLFFCGPPGTGKTYAARALAGEVRMPLITIPFCRDAPYRIRLAMSIAKRYENCIVFVDESEKLMGVEDSVEGPFMGFMEAMIDGADKEGLKSMVIFAMNSAAGFGRAMKDRSTIITFDLPRSEDRAEYFRRKMRSLPRNIIKLGENDLSSATEGFSYRRMERLWEDLIACHVSEKKAVDPETLNSVLDRPAQSQELDYVG